SIIECIVERRCAVWKNIHDKKIQLLKHRREFTLDSQTNQINPITNLSNKILNDDEKEALINGLDFVPQSNKFDEQSFIANVELCFVSLLGYQTDQFDWEDKDQ
ncbi:unnamed protein product, partial [Didymodactylos carnosus]